MLKNDDPPGGKKIVDGLVVKRDMVSLTRDPDRLQRLLNSLSPDELRFVKTAIDALINRTQQS